MLNAFLPALLGVVLVAVHYANWVRATKGHVPYLNPHIINEFGLDPAQIAESAAENVQMAFGVAALTLCVAIAFKRSRHARLRRSVERNRR